MSFFHIDYDIVMSLHMKIIKVSDVREALGCRVRRFAMLITVVSNIKHLSQLAKPGNSSAINTGAMKASASMSLYSRLATSVKMS